jgi:hypothetical protein
MPQPYQKASPQRNHAGYVIDIEAYAHVHTTAPNLEQVEQGGDTKRGENAP